MLGGEFIIHGAQQPAVLKCVDPKFPGAAAFDNASFSEEWYSLKNFAPDLHVILTQHCDKMKGPMYQSASSIPKTWARMHGKGRVFLHFDGPPRRRLEQAGVSGIGGGARWKWITGQVEVDVTPNIKEGGCRRPIRKQWESGQEMMNDEIRMTNQIRITND